jgi:hypothetical protein
MVRRPRYHSDFDLDVIEAAEWYAKASRELAIDFTFRVEQAVQDILTAPESRTDVDYGLRYWPIARFPHIVFFDFSDTEVLLLGVMHPSQRPDKWISRSEES